MKLILPLLLAPALLTAQGRGPDFTTPVWTSPVEFTHLYWIRELSDGRLILPDPGERVVHLLGADGRPLGTIGTQGGGPGEFQLPLHVMALRGDTTLLNDREQQRFLVIGPDGKPVRTIPWPTMQRGSDGLQNGMQGDGLGNIYFPRSVLRGDPGVTPLLRWNPANGQVDSVQVLAMPKTVRSEPRPGVTSTSIVPYDEGDVWGVAQGGAIAVVHPREYQLEWRAVDGTINRGTAIPYRAAPVTAEERTEDFGPNTDLPIPTTKPAVTRTGILVSPRGEVWVSRYPAPGEERGRWDVLSKDGKLLRSLTLPGRRTIIGFGRNLVYVVRYDDDDIQHLEAYR